MRILYVTPTFVPSHFGGVKEVSYQLSKNMVQRGHDVVVFTTDADIGKFRLKDISGMRNISGIKVRYFKNISNLLAWRYRLFLPVGVSLVTRKNVRSFDIIHLHDIRRFQSIITHHYANKYNIPYIIQAHGSLATYFTKGPLKKIFDRLWGYKILKDAAKVIALTPTEAEQYKSMGVSEEKIEIVPNGIDLTEFENLPARGIFRKKYGLQDNQKLILYLGRIHKIKGLDILIKAFAGMARDLDNIKLVIAGPDDGYLTELKALITELGIEDRVVLTGPLYGRDKLEAYIDAEVYVLSSIYETFPVTVLEACACGLPVVVTDRCGIANLVDGQIGLVIPYDKEYLGSAILQILSNDQMRRGFAERGRSLVREKFNWEKIAGQVEKIYLCAGKF